MSEWVSFSTVYVKNHMVLLLAPVGRDGVCLGLLDPRLAGVFGIRQV